MHFLACRKAPAEMRSLRGPGVHAASQATRLGKRALRALWPREGSQFSGMTMGLGYKKLVAHLSGPFAERPHCLDIIDTVPGRLGHKTPGFANRSWRGNVEPAQPGAFAEMQNTRAHSHHQAGRSYSGAQGHANPLIIHTGVLTPRGTYLHSTLLFTHGICSPARHPFIYTHPCTH